MQNNQFRNGIAVQIGNVEERPGQTKLQPLHVPGFGAETGAGLLEINPDPQVIGDKQVGIRIVIEARPLKSGSPPGDVERRGSEIDFLTRCAAVKERGAEKHRKEKGNAGVRGTGHGLSTSRRSL